MPLEKLTQICYLDKTFFRIFKIECFVVRNVTEDEIKNWLNDSCKGFYVQIFFPEDPDNYPNTNCVLIQRKTDAAMFKLAFS